MKIAKKEFRLVNGMPAAVVWSWSDGEVTEIPLDELNGMEPWFLANGVSQKLGDAYSGCKTVKEARAALEATFAQVVGDRTWAKKGEGGGQVAILAEALHRVMMDNPFAEDVPDLETIRAKVKEMDAKAIKAMKAKWPSIDQAILDIKRERLEAKMEGQEQDDEKVMEDLADLFG